MTEVPDVNVLIALVWESHVHHGAARRWFATDRGARWATCAITQTGFVRVSSNPKILPDAIAVQQAVATLAELIGHADHGFLTDGAGFVDNPLVPHDRLVGHRQVTDAHLISIARQHEAVVVTFDGGVESLGGDSVRRIR
jgi:toxin-antitoxin system PIN domain toxin